jgi:hypothetical protein
MHAFMGEMAGYTKPWFLVTTALGVSAAQGMTVWKVRIRQTDGYRDHA